MLTPAGAIEDRFDGLGLGADDFLTKPFALAELVADSCSGPMLASS